MPKIKKKIAEKVYNKKAENAKKSINPFEVHINKQKYDILGQKNKNDRGLPGVSRAKAIRKRKHTLLPEYNVRDKSNKFVDRRIGERNFSMTEEDRTMARFTAERMKHHNRKSIYNLADDEILTHRGQTLSEIEKYDDPRSDDENDYDEEGRKPSGKLDDSFVGDAHFGGGVLTKTGKEGAKSHKDLIDQLIAESKKRKAEKQKTKEETLELTEKLDSEWKDLIPLVSRNKKDDQPEIHQKPDDYDKVMRELIFEARGNPTDRLKSEDEVAREEKERLEKLEQDRLNRMMGIVEKPSDKRQHRSADDLDDNFNYDSDPEETLAYDEEGKIRNDFLETVESKNNQKKVENIEESEQEDENGEDGESSEAETDDDLSDLKESESDDSDEENIHQKNDKKKEVIIENTNIEKNENIPKASEKEIISKERKRKISETDRISINENTKLNEKESENVSKERKRKLSENDNLVINKNTNYIENESEIINIKKISEFNNSNINIYNEQKETININKERKRKISENDVTTKIQKTENEFTNDIKEENFVQNLIIQNEMIEKAKKELPYTYKLPESYESLQSLLSNQPPEYQDVIIERMIKCNHPSLGPENKDNLGRLFVYLLQHLNDVSPDNTVDSTDSIKNCFAVLNSLTPHFYTLTQLNPLNSLTSLIEVIQEKQNDYRKAQKHFPGIDVLVFLKLISCLFSTSDFRHQVVTPAFVFISQMLTNCRVKTRYDIVYGLFLVTLFIEYTTLSKRFLPAVMIYLMGILHMAVPKLGVRLVKIYPPFKSNATALVLAYKCKKCNDLKMSVDDFVQTEIDEQFKVKIFNLTLDLCQELQENWNNLSSDIIIFDPFYELLNKIPKEKYPNNIRDKIKKMIDNNLETKKNKKLSFIIMEQKKPKALRLYEPNIQPVFEFRRGKPMMSRERAEREKLLHKFKQERKGALREIRRDKSFLGRVKVKHQIQSDYERREKVKRIYAEASMQQSELNAFDRQKKRK